MDPHDDRLSPAAQRPSSSAGLREHGHRLDRALQRLQPGRVALAEPDHHADPRPALERRADPLPPGDHQTRRNHIRERVVDRNIKDDVGDHSTTSVRQLGECGGHFWAPAYGEPEELDEYPLDTLYRDPSPERASYSRRASLRSSQAMRRNSGPGLRSRKAGWKVGTSTLARY